MNTPPPDSDPRWEKLLRQARADTPPPVNLAALHRALRSATPGSPGWLAEFAQLFSPSRALPACLAAGVMVALFASWQLWELWQSLPWAEFLVVTGGAS